MIVIDDGKHWQIIFQRTHAQLAADIAYYIDPEYHPQQVPFPLLLTAIADHDDGRQQWEGRLHITADGAPMDYRKQVLDLKIQQANKSIANSQYRSPWIGLLTSMHQVHLYRSYAEKNSNVAEFIQKQEDYQKRMQELLKINTEISKEAYNFMQLCDELSLILCEELCGFEDSLKAGNLPLLSSCYIKRNYRGTYTVEPWCFKKKSFNLSIFLYKLPRKNFSSDNELLELLRKSTPRKKKWHFKTSGKQELRD